MKVIDPKVKALEQIDIINAIDKDSDVEDISQIQNGLFNGIINHIEECNTFCLRESLKDSVKDGRSLDILEHGTVYLTIPIGKPDPNNKEDYMNRMNVINFYENNPDSVVRGYKSSEDNVLYVYFITTNYRVIVENNRHQDLIFLFNSSEYHIKRSTYSIITNRHTANKLSKIKYLNVSISDPVLEDNKITVTSHSFDDNAVAKSAWIDSCKASYKIYEALIDGQTSKSNAYKILPDTVVVHVILSAFNDDLDILFKTLDEDDDVDYCDILHMIAYDHDNKKISEEIADEIVEETSEETGEIETTTETTGNTDIPE